MNMKKVLVSATLALMIGGLMTEALARPMGGGRNVGRQSQSVSKMAPQPAPPAAAPAPGRQTANTPANTPNTAPVPAQKPSMWKGLLGGALLGLGLGALLSHFGLGGALASAIGTILTVLLIAGAAFLIWRLVRSKMQPRTAAPAGFGNLNGNGGNAWQPPVQQPQQQPFARTPEIGSGLQQPASAGGLNLDKPQPAAAAHAPWGVPADFDTATFLRHAKGNFIRLQAAWDKADTNDIREFTTPEVFAEMRMQIQERGDKVEFTDVVTIDAELLGIENDGRDYVASVKFWGTIKPAPDALPEPFQEVWNLVKPMQGDKGWLLGGIQQLA